MRHGELKPGVMSEVETEGTRRHVVPLRRSVAYDPRKVARYARAHLRVTWRDLVINGVAAWPVIPIHFRWLILRLCGLDIDRCQVASGVWFGSTQISIGERSFINHRCVFDALAPIAIGRRCDVAIGVTFITSTHELAGKHRRAGILTSRGIEVGHGCWLGANSTILPGVTIGDGVVVAAGSVVVHDCAPHGLYAGVPARRIRDLEG